MTLALALAITENPRVDPVTQSLVAVLATGFVVFTLLVNGLTLQPMIRLLKLDRLSPLNQVLRRRVVALATVEVKDAVKDTAEAYEIAPSVTNAVAKALEARLDSGTPNTAFEATISDRDRITIGLIALTNREHKLILDHHAQHTVSVAAIERLLRNTNRILDAAKAEGRIGYNRASRELVAFSRMFRFSHFLQHRFGIERPLVRQISTRFETLLVRGVALKELTRFNEQRLRPLVGSRIANVLADVLAARIAATSRAIEALRLQYPDHAEGLERHFLRQTGLRLELSLFRQLRDEGLIGRDLYDALEREHMAESDRAGENRPLDLGLRTEELIARFDMFRGLGAAEHKGLSRLLRSRLALPDEKIIRKGDRGTHVYFISSGAVEVVLPQWKVRLGRGDFFGEMALLSGRRRAADVVALGDGQLLVLSAADFRRFLAANPSAKAEIDRIVAARTLMNEEFARALSTD